MIIAILEDDDRRQQAMREHLGRLSPACEPAFFDNAPDMLNWLQTHLAEVALVCLDHDLGPNRTRAGQVFDPGNGRDVASYLAACAPRCPIIVHTSNPEAAPGMLWELESAGWTVRRVIPFDDLQWVESSWAERVTECLSRGRGRPRPQIEMHDYRKPLEAKSCSISASGKEKEVLCLSSL